MIRQIGSHPWPGSERLREWIETGGRGAQRRLAEATDISESELSRFKLERQEPRASHIEALCRAMGCSANWLLGLPSENPVYEKAFREMYDSILQIHDLLGLKLPKIKELERLVGKPPSEEED